MHNRLNSKGKAIEFIRRYARIQFSLFRWDISISLSALCPWNNLKVYRTEFSRHLVCGRLSILIENWAIECHALCAECGDSDIAERRCGDESLTVCGSCRSVEQGYRYVNLREYENAPNAS